MLFVLLGLSLVAGEPDADRDGLSDFHEIHKYLTDPKSADSDGDGIPDGDWDERREFNYSVHAVMHVMAPFDVASMNDDYQDVRVLDVRPDLLEFEVVVYPFNNVAEAIEPNARWSKQPAEMKEYLAPGVCCNWDKEMQSQLLDELKARSVDVSSSNDVEAAKAVSKWLMDRSTFEDSFTTFAVEFEDEKPRVTPRQQSGMDDTLEKFGRTLEQQFDRELFGKGMFETKLHGSCTSSAIYLSTGLKAVGLPTRTIVCVPLIDSSDDREVSWVDTRITHQAVRSVVRQAAEDQRGSWTSHTFNEVYVGGRWRRLNYTNLGQNVFDANTLGLMVHVHTFNDHSEAGLVGWGNRGVHPLHATLFGGPNPYSCISLSDRFGAHSKVANEPLGGIHEASITKICWYDDPEGPSFTTELQSPEGAGFFFVHFEVDHPAADGSDCMAFYNAADKRFALRAKGRDDVPAGDIGKYWGGGRDANDFILRIEPGDFARMEPGVEYVLVWDAPDQELHWKIAKGVAITRPGR